jgi:hypothetical protein
MQALILGLRTQYWYTPGRCQKQHLIDDGVVVAVQRQRNNQGSLTQHDAISLRFLVDGFLRVTA